MTDIVSRLAELGLSLPPPSAPAANYVPFTRSGSLVHIAGQVSRLPDADMRGVVGCDLSIDDGRLAARASGLNIVAQIGAACGGDFGRLTRILKLNGLIQCNADFDELPQVMNGCSDLMVDLFGDAGRHARTTVGVYRLPFGYAVEADAVVEIHA